MANNRRAHTSHTYNRTTLFLFYFLIFSIYFFLYQVQQLQIALLQLLVRGRNQKRRNQNPEEGFQVFASVKVMPGIPKKRIPLKHRQNQLLILVEDHYQHPRKIKLLNLSLLVIDQI